ncbi:Myosin-M heavy chain [Neolecta irregularis DAH-3]|uniref:Myosin-M heavy chain n=1 Tax=Neolecta irregularis (strain DAH-3) TaxID=1198029 RepID=A0A1U7LTB3_NEOID|nr:Myosin-M heavy chain [Neolecta irregularis DAH-3]|eukprot:OLL25869.1 Myosin-M heavy chain [Neolecta irregularis DAH-3]
MSSCILERHVTQSTLFFLPSFLSVISSSEGSNAILQQTRSEPIISSKHLFSEHIRSHSAPSFSEFEERQNRETKRRHIIEELVSTEEGYVNDLKCLVEIYFRSLARQSWISQSDLLALRRNITAILDLQIAILESMKRDFPREATGLRIAAVASKVLTEKGNRFMVYQQYCLEHDDALQVIHRHYKSREWQAWERSCWTIAEHDTATSKRAMRLNDLIAKPIQRLCRYSLILNDLLLNTPIQDDYEAHHNLKDAHLQMTNIVSEINESKRHRPNKRTYSLHTVASSISSKTSLSRPSSLLKKSNSWTEKLSGRWKRRIVTPGLVKLDIEPKTA